MSVCKLRVLDTVRNVFCDGELIIIVELVDGAWPHDGAAVSAVVGEGSGTVELSAKVMVEPTRSMVMGRRAYVASGADGVLARLSRGVLLTGI